MTLEWTLILAELRIEAPLPLGLVGITEAVRLKVPTEGLGRVAVHSRLEESC